VLAAGALCLAATLLAWQLLAPPAACGPRRLARAPAAAAAATAPPPAALPAPAPPAPGTPPLVDLRLAHRLLPLTNLSALSTAALLDAAPGLGPADARALVRLHQELHCRCACVRQAGGAGV
jgi:hypothetical protein